MSLFAELLSTFFERGQPSRPTAADSNKSLASLINSLMSVQGELSGQSVAGAILDKFAAADAETRMAFFRYLLDNLGLDPDLIRSSLAALEAEPGKATYQAFSAAAEPPRQEFIRRLNQYPGATRSIVAMRLALRELGRAHPELMAIDVDFHHLLSSWFNRGFLVLRPISWESPAHILEKIIAYEAVHEIGGWNDLRLRLEPLDRRCYAFFHPAMPDDPLIFVEVALTQDIPSSIPDLLVADRVPLDSEAFETAVFYSISNCQAGLSGISFGNSLIKQVASDLARELPQLKTFVTLSPIPGFERWMADADHDAAQTEGLQSLAARYLVMAKRQDGMPLDPVARFHLSNGAEVHRLCPDADPSETGMSRSRGMMVNYLYNLERVGANLEDFAKHRSVRTSKEVRALVTDEKSSRSKHVKSPV